MQGSLEQHGSLASRLSTLEGAAVAFIVTWIVHTADHVRSNDFRIAGSAA